MDKDAQERAEALGNTLLPDHLFDADFNAAHGELDDMLGTVYLRDLFTVAECQRAVWEAWT